MMLHIYVAFVPVIRFRLWTMWYRNGLSGYVCVCVCVWWKANKERVSSVVFLNTAAVTVCLGG